MKNQHEKHIKAIGHKLRWVKCKLLLLKKNPPLTSSSADEQVTNIQMLSCSGITWRRDWKEKMSLWSSGWPFIIWLRPVHQTRYSFRNGLVSWPGAVATDLLWVPNNIFVLFSFFWGFCLDCYTSLFCTIFLHCFYSASKFCISLIVLLKPKWWFG